MLVSNSLTDSLTHCCLVNLIDVTLRREDATSKLVVVVAVAVAVAFAAAAAAAVLVLVLGVVLFPGLEPLHSGNSAVASA